MLGRKILLAAIGTLMAVLLCEALLTLYPRDLALPMLYPGDIQTVRDESWNPHVGWTLPPNTVQFENTSEYSVEYQVNAHGFRSRDLEVISGARRLVFVGDSFTMGTGVAGSETFAAQVEQMMPKTVAYNLGIGSWGLDQMWMAIVHYGLPLEPDLVVLAFIRDDLDRTRPAYRQDHIWREKPTFWLDDGELAPLTAEHQPPFLRRFLHRRSRLHALSRRTERSLSRWFAIGSEWRLNRAIFAAIRDACAEARVPLLVVHIPVNRRHSVPMFGRELAELEIDYLDLTPRLPADADRLYFSVDRHFNAAGHRFAAEAIDEAIVSRYGWSEHSPEVGIEPRRD